ncbi:hypothetical protein BHM03_00055288, partial [Ensete ventricosum]
VEADSLLKREVETLAEALETANNAVFLALSTISIMISILQSYGEAKVGFGAGYDIKSSIKQAVVHCPLGGSLKNEHLSIRNIGPGFDIAQLWAKECTLYYSNGDVFQGSWRDDLIHGKVISTWTARYQAVP